MSCLCVSFYVSLGHFVSVLLALVVLGLVSLELSQEIGWEESIWNDLLLRMSPKWHILCRVGCKTLTQWISLYKITLIPPKENTVHWRFGCTSEAFIRTDFRYWSSLCKSLSHTWLNWYPKSKKAGRLITGDHIDQEYRQHESRRGELPIEPRMGQAFTYWRLSPEVSPDEGFQREAETSINSMLLWLY